MITLSPSDFLSASSGTASAITLSAFGDTVTSSGDSFGVIFQGTLTTSVNTIIPAVAGATRLIKTITLSNTTSSSVPNIKLYVNGNTATSQIINLAIPANGSAKFDASGWSVYDASGSLLTFGLNGRGIVSINLTNTVGLVDTYTITYTDNSTSTYTVTNGDTPTVVVGATTVVNPNVAPSVTDADAGMDVDLRFNLPRAPTVTSGTITTGAPGTNASVATVVEPDGDVVLNFTIPRGDTGATGQAAFTSTTANFTQPASAANVTVSVLSTTWMSTGQYLFIETGGYYQVSSITNPTTVVLTNLGYPENATPGSTIASGSKVSSAGVRGATGANGQSVAVADEGNQLTAAATSLNFVGAGVTATNSGSAVTVTVNGGNSFASVTGNTGTATADSPGDTIAITGGTGISTAATDTPDGLVITNEDRGSVAVSDHVAQADPHPQYLKKADALGQNETRFSFATDPTNTILEFGPQANRATSAATIIDFHSGAAAIDYDSRIIATQGNGTSGGGILEVVAATFAHNGNTVWDAGNHNGSGNPHPQYTNNAAVTRTAPTASASTALTTIQSYPVAAGEITAGSEYEFTASLRVINTTAASNAVVTLSVGATNVLVLTQAIGTTAAAAPGAAVIVEGVITFLSTTQAECRILAIKQAAVAFTAVTNTSAPITVSAAGATTIDLKFNTSAATSTFIARQASIRRIK